MMQSKPEPPDLSLIPWKPGVEAPKDTSSNQATSEPERRRETTARPEPGESMVQFWKIWRGWLLFGLFLLILVLVLAALAGAGLIDAGFGAYTPPTSGGERGKTLWDWMELLLVPAAIVFGAALYTWVTNRREREADDRRTTAQQKMEEERARETALQTYFDRMAELLKDGLFDPQRGNVKRGIGRAQTLTVLRQLDGERKGLLLQFLYESGLIGMWNETEGRQEALVDLSEANLSGANLTVAIPWEAVQSAASPIGADLSGANLSKAIAVMAYLEGVNLREANLTGANLTGANLTGANLWDADLSRANLSGASLHDANLSSAVLIMANLSRANLSGVTLYEANAVGANLTNACLERANLSGANLTWANLQGARVTDEQLGLAKSLKGTTLPDGTKHE